LSEIFGEKLRNRRLEKGLTLEALAEKIGSTKAYVWQLENKKPAKPSGELLLKIANVLDISAEFLIDDSVSRPTNTQVQIALARGMGKRGLSQKDVDRLFKISDTIKDGKTSKGSE
jgi:transcriptional regulator with XRE-family HTH domain